MGGGAGGSSPNWGCWGVGVLSPRGRLPHLEAFWPSPWRGCCWHLVGGARSEVPGSRQVWSVPFLCISPRGGGRGRGGLKCPEEPPRWDFLSNSVPPRSWADLKLPTACRPPRRLLRPSSGSPKESPSSLSEEASRAASPTSTVAVGSPAGVTALPDGSAFEGRYPLTPSIFTEEFSLSSSIV